MGNNEFVQAGDGGIKGNTGDLSGLRSESQESQVRAVVGNLDETRTACEAKCGPMKDWMSTKDNGFLAATNDFVAQSKPEDIKTKIAENDAKIALVGNLIAGIEQKIGGIMNAKAQQEKLDLERRLASMMA